MFAHAVLALMLAAQTDQTVNVKKGAKLDVSHFAGDIVVKVWDRDAVRVEAEHSDRESVDIRTTDQLVTIRTRREGAASRPLDYTLTIPKWMPVNITGTMADVDIDGAGADVTVETVRGDIRVRGGSGFVRLQSMQGRVSLENARGHIEARALNEGIALTGVSGDISVEAVNGGIDLQQIDASNVDVSTVNGRISYDGPIKDRGIYRLSTHNGRIDMVMADNANATMVVHTYNGDVRATFPLKTDDQDRHRRTLTFGNGSARLEVSTFNGEINLRRPGEPAPARSRDRTRADRDRDSEAKDKNKPK